MGSVVYNGERSSVPQRWSVADWIPTRSVGTIEFAYPGETEHKGEHQRVLGEFKQFKSRVDKGLIAFGRSFVKDRLPQWFGLYVTTMDSALAAHINKQD